MKIKNLKRGFEVRCLDQTDKTHRTFKRSSGFQKNHSLSRDIRNCETLFVNLTSPT